MSSDAPTLPAPPSTMVGTTAGVPSKLTNWAPTAKVSIGLLAAAVTALIMPYWSGWTGHNPSASDGAAITTVITFLMQYIVPDRANATQQ